MTVLIRLRYLYLNDRFDNNCNSLNELIFFRRMFKKKRKRYLPHDPNMILEKTIVEDNDTVIEQPVTVEALNLQPPITMEEGCGGSSGFHSVSSQSPVQPKEDFKERQTQFNSIV